MKIEVKNVSKKFKKEKVLNNINIVFETGKIYGLVGRNGTGKSVFLKLLSGIYTPDEGEIIYNNIDIIKTNSYPPSTRALIENPMFIDEYTGMENLLELARMQNLITEKEILETCNLLNLTDNINKKFKNYSLGTKQKLGIAQAIMEDTEVIILDEPFNGLEITTVRNITKYLKKVKKEKIIIMATHIKEDIEKLCDEVYEFSEANIIKYNNK